MNLRLFSIALLVSAIPMLSSADPAISFDRADFVAAKEASRDGETIVSVKLSKSGKAKIKKLNALTPAPEVHAEIAGVSSDFKWKGPITGDEMEMGAYAVPEAQKVVSEINRK